MPNDSNRDPLPFEPTRKQKKAQKAKPAAPKQNAAKEVSEPKRQMRSQEDNSIPEVVSSRMFRPMFFFSGIPVLLGILVFFSSYVVITQEIAELPNVIVLLTTLACFGLSVLGLSYGVLSSSWDETSAGTLVGLDEFQLNFGRLVGSWRDARENRRKKS
jgi:hypothetical protein